MELPPHRSSARSCRARPEEGDIPIRDTGKNPEGKPRISEIQVWTGRKLKDTPVGKATQIEAEKPREVSDPDKEGLV